MDKKTYEIDGVSFNLKTDYDLDESDKLTSLFGGLEAENNKIISGKFSNNQIKEILSIVLIPQTSLQESFNYGKAKETVVAEVIKDFFLNRIASNVNIRTYLSDLTMKPN